MIPLTIEEALRSIEERAAVLRHLAAGAPHCGEPPTERVWAGLETIAEEVETQIRRSLPRAAAEQPVRTSQRR